MLVILAYNDAAAARISMRRRISIQLAEIPATEKPVTITITENGSLCGPVTGTSVGSNLPVLAPLTCVDARSAAAPAPVAVLELSPVPSASDENWLLADVDGKKPK